MIRRCFSIFDGVGPTRERAIRAAGITDWGAFMATAAIPGVSEALRRSVAGQIVAWAVALARGDAGFFAEHLPRPKHWMLWERFADRVRYLDIETTGLSARQHDVTLVGIGDGRRFEVLVKGRDLTADRLAEALAGCEMLVTYFGTQFDVPFLRAKFPTLRWDYLHFDLCTAGRRLGLTGGLKKVERTLGIDRGDEIADVDGFEAVRLWRRYERGDRAALRKLIDYNEADTRNLVRIAEIMRQRLR